MKIQDITKYIDHTILAPTASEVDVKRVCEESVKYNAASACIIPYYVKKMHNDFPSLNICTVVGFPLGYNTLESKVFETKEALAKGAKEIDMVINNTLIKNGEYKAIYEEIATLKKVCGSLVLKVIIETSYLSEQEKIEMCKIVGDADADYIKTSTGFGPSGADLKDIELFKKHLDDKVKIKAAGGIRDLESVISYINAGCTRIGTSSMMKFILT
ncbi:MAG: deoxyribose-phosphate aldolase [Bacteroidia bacterium]|jgi:deoxyribose-phosphate aldolase|nr:deoxyribose-phosphate aldolase [Bacteroidia bacterium]